MRNLVLALLALLGALLIGIFASQPPAAKPASAPAQEFSAGRAMGDIRAIARAPRPTGSAENARVRAYVVARMRQIGMTVEAQVGPLPAKSTAKLVRWGGPGAAAREAVNIIGLLPGRDRRKPAVLLMAHLDSVWASPGAADDAAGMAAALEIVRAVAAGGRPERDLAVLFTDAEELGLAGAKMFFASHPLASRIGPVVNMESRGGGGRTAMFETGRGNGAMMDVYRRSVSRPSANSLAVLIYEVMPNNTDFTMAKERGLAGFNFAFIGDAGLYHSPASTPEAFDPATLQDLGAQALGVTRALALAETLPGKSRDAVFGDVLGLFVIAYSPAAGWAVLGLGAALIGFAWVRVRVSVREVTVGAGRALGLLVATGLLLFAVNLLSGRSGNYYDRLASLPRLELQAGILCLAPLLIACAAWRPARQPSGFWGGWLGIAALVFLLALATQAIAPTAAPVLVWPLLLCGAGMATAAAFDPELKRVPVAAFLVLIAALAGGQILYLAHFTFLGIGAKTPEVMALYSLLLALLVWPLMGTAAASRAFGAAAVILILGAAGIALSVRLDPMAETIPPYSEKR